MQLPAVACSVQIQGTRLRKGSTARQAAAGEGPRFHTGVDTRLCCLRAKALHEKDGERRVKLGCLHVADWREQGLRRCIQIAL